MGAFEHIIALLSFVYALAIAHLLMTAARLIASSERVRFSWFHAYWMANALFVLVIDWISFWDMHAVSTWTIASIAMVLMQSFVDYMQAALACPEIPPDGEIDLVAFHATRARRYIGAFAVTTVWALVDNLYFGGGYNLAELTMQNFAVVPLIFVATFATIVRRRWADIVTILLLVAIWSFYLAGLQGALK